ncbi:hypothetical protein FB382_003638 [Nocardioides ginsengisegetis]|uniref:Uncharacterized protein n=1 Tax=Nocardioides ginsengisegetis TaxID=661491 RepID=A0A7W3PBC4_9ACTN|nr:hypothetical protein [Nocardioides ginsengisegetis]MBA8805347.1 hypothetical protein [Nocardioides ginsengisegetis]
MPTIDLGTPPRPTPGLLEALPRRVALTLPELRLVAERAGGAPLPFDPTAPTEPMGGNPLDGRLGRGPGSIEDEAYADALDSLHDPDTTLVRRGLCTPDGAVDDGLVGAVGLLATPEVALDLDVAVVGVQAKAWHRQAGGAVATLATVDGIVFELAWFATDQWPHELARVAAVPEDVALHDSAVPVALDLPFELADAAAEAVRSGRSDLLPVLVSQHAGQALDATGTPYADGDVATALAALTTEHRGRLRALVADVSGSDTTVVGVVSWVLLADGWRALHPHTVDGVHRVDLRRVEPFDLASELAPVLAEVTA